MGERLCTVCGKPARHLSRNFKEHITKDENGVRYLGYIPLEKQMGCDDHIPVCMVTTLDGRKVPMQDRNLEFASKGVKEILGSDVQ